MQLTAILSVCIFAQALLATSIFVLLRNDRGKNFSLALFFASVAIIHSWQVVAFVDASGVWSSALDALSLPFSFVLAPALWYYVRALTSSLNDPLDRQELFHLIPAGIASLLFLTLLIIPSSARIAIMDGEIVQISLGKFAQKFERLTYFGLPIQMAIYIGLILKHLARNRTMLKNLYASTEEKELGWVRYFGIVFFLQWSLGFASDLSDLIFETPFFQGPLVEIGYLVLFWTFAIWAARQPRIHHASAEHENLIDKPKYGRAALANHELEKIAARIHLSMSKDKLYRDPDLSLRKLSTAIRTKPNHVSQTLNREIGEIFFDFVNRWRIEDAKRRIVSGDETVLKIAYDVGFNSRSSFYRSFKRVTDTTPAKYKAAATGTKYSEFGLKAAD